MIMKIVNLTPHDVNIVMADGNVRKFPAEGVIARAEQFSDVVGQLNGIELVRTRFGQPIDLPDYADGVYYIVSVITANAAKAAGRTTADLLLTSDPVRDETTKQIIGCKRFALFD